MHTQIDVNELDAFNGAGIVAQDEYLAPFTKTLQDRFDTFKWWAKDITQKEGSLAKFAEGYKIFGFHRVNGGIRYKVWAPGARAVSIIGDFNEWNRGSHPCTRDEYGSWSILIPDKNGAPAIQHGTKVKLSITTPSGEVVTRIDPWAKYVIQEKKQIVFDGVYWNPPEPYQWKHPRPQRPTNLKIYETHVGMATKEQRIGTYLEFARDIIPYIADMGYNAIQVMAVMEHTYYASFGYQVTNFYAASSRFGTPEELKCMIDTAHKYGLYVLLDVVHSHASKNTADGINYFDGTDSCFFHGGDRGVHPIWDSRLFNYTSWEVLRFLLSNLRWWIEEYKFDGFRFDGVTAMILQNRAVGEIPMDYVSYYGPSMDGDAIRYLTLANYMLHTLYPFIITIAEEATGLPGMARKISDGGIGFDYRLAMGLPDKWKKLMVTKDEDWNMGNIAFELTNRRYLEPNVAYVESHDQALVGDKTIAFWLMDKEMYTDMSVLFELKPVIDRGIALHKMIRLITCALGGEAYLTFMGNEFGHPEWIDFPREGNNDSYHYCRRQWNLKDDPLLRYQHLCKFEKAMLHLESKYKLLGNLHQFVSLAHEGDKVIVFEKGTLLFAFNFHPSQSYSGFRIGVERAGKYRIVLDSDAELFGGHKRNDPNTIFTTYDLPWNNRANSLDVYLPCRTAVVFAPVEKQ